MEKKEGAEFLKESSKKLLATIKYENEQRVAKIERMILEAGAVSSIIHNREEISPNMELLLLGTAMNFRTWFDRYLNYRCVPGAWEGNEVTRVKLDKFYKDFSDLMIGAFCSLDKLFYNKIAIQALGDESFKLLDSSGINALLDDMRSLKNYI